MGIMMSKDLNNSSELDQRISADLRARTQNMQTMDHDGMGEDVERTAKKTGKFTWVWIVLIVLAIISLICIAFI